MKTKVWFLFVCVLFLTFSFGLVVPAEAQGLGGSNTVYSIAGDGQTAAPAGVCQSGWAFNPFTGAKCTVLHPQDGCQQGFKYSPVTGAKCSDDEGEYNLVISGVKGPQTLSINQKGTWTISAYDTAGGDLSYSVRWGDEAYYATFDGYAGASAAAWKQDATFTHTYSKSGTYSPVFRVQNENGDIEETSMSLKVGNVYEGESIKVNWPSKGETWKRGYTYSIAWQDNAPYECATSTASYAIPCISPRYDITLHPVFSEDRNDYTPRTIAQGVNGTTYEWYISPNLEKVSGAYVMNICRSGSEKICGQSEKFNITSGSNVGTSITPNSLPGGQVGYYYSQTNFTVDGLSSYDSYYRYKWSIKKGSLPKGLVLQVSYAGIGVVGIPTQAETKAFVVSAKNGDQELTKEYTISIKPASKSYDTDGGRNYYVKGETYGPTKCVNQSECNYPTLSVDSCDGDTVNEYYIAEDGYKYVDFYHSPTGCENGAAKISTSKTIKVVAPNGGNYNSSKPFYVSWNEYKGDFDYYYVGIGNKETDMILWDYNTGLGRVSKNRNYLTVPSLEPYLTSFFANGGTKMSNNFFVVVDAYEDVYSDGDMTNDRVVGEGQSGTFSIVSGSTTNACPLTANVTSTYLAENNTTWGFYVLVNATNAKTSDRWFTTLQGYHPDPTPYGVSKLFGNFFLNSGPLKFTAQDYADNNCQTTITVYPPAKPTPASSVTLKSPNGGETWEIGTARTISWSDLNPVYPCFAAPCPSASYQIKLYRAADTEAFYPVANSVTGSSFVWSVGTYNQYDSDENYVSDGKYRMEVCRLGNYVCDSSDANFEVYSGGVLGASSYNFTQKLLRGSAGAEVKELQKYLSEAGYYDGDIDGRFGLGTEVALVKWQMAYKLKADGVVGAEVRAILNAR